MRDEYPTTGGTIDVTSGGRMGLGWQCAEGERIGYQARRISNIGYVADKLNLLESVSSLH